MVKVLLLTYKDCDNVGDKVIEACALPLLKLVLTDLNVKDFSIDSQDIDSVLLDNIKDYKMVVFGGGGIIKYKYQNFYQRISLIVSAANRSNVPVIFSSVGVEGYNIEDHRCRILKEAINKSCVKQITTRDDLETLKLYIEDRNAITVTSAADPAIYSKYVFKAEQDTEASTIGLAVVRSGIFQANGIEWSLNNELRFWKDVITLLEEKGLDYKIFTTGHFADEVFAFELIKKWNLGKDKLIAPIYSSEQLITTLTQMAGIIAFRLHAGIVSYSLNVPAVNLSWNDKVALFYRTVNLSERVLMFKDWNAEKAVDSIVKAMLDRREREKDLSFMYSTYSTLFDGVIKCLLSNKVLSEKSLGKKRTIDEIINDDTLYQAPRSEAQLFYLANNRILDLETRYAKLESKVKILRTKRPPSLKRRIKGTRLGRLLLKIYHLAPGS